MTQERADFLKNCTLHLQSFQVEEQGSGAGGSRGAPSPCRRAPYDLYPRPSLQAQVSQHPSGNRRAEGSKEGKLKDGELQKLPVLTWDHRMEWRPSPAQGPLIASFAPAGHPFSILSLRAPVWSGAHRPPPQPPQLRPGPTAGLLAAGTYSGRVSCWKLGPVVA